MTEAQFQDWVAEYAQLNGWLVYHGRPAQQVDGGWRTPVQYDGKGFPDLVLVRRRVIFAELKTERGTVSPDQRKWGTALQVSEGIDYFVWRPSDRPTIEQILRRPPRGT